MMRLMTVAIVCGLAVPAQAEGPDSSLTYRQSLDSVYLVFAVKDEKHHAYGSGVLVDAQRGYVLTAHHVLGKAKTAILFPPARDAAGEVVSDPNYYLANQKQLGVACEVIDQDAKRDLALLRMPTPVSGRAIPIARKSARPGQHLLNIGNAIRTRKDKLTGVLWRCSVGAARQVYEDSYSFEDGQEITARVLDMSVPVDHGDSGGPVITRTGELVGIASAIVTKENLNHKAIDVMEIWAFLRKPDREMSFTLYDAGQSSPDGPTTRLSYLIIATKGLESPSPVTHRFEVTTDTAGALSVSPVQAVATGK